MSFGVTPLSTTLLDINQFPVGAVYVPGTTDGNFTTLAGGPALPADSNGNVSAPALMYLNDGFDVTQGSSGDANTVNSVMGRLTKIRDVLLATLTVSGTVTANVGTTNGLALDATVTKLTIAQATTLGTSTGPLVQGSVTTGVPAYTPGTINPLSLTTTGALRVDGSGITQPVSGTFWQTTQPVSGAVTANQGGTWTVQPGNIVNTTAWKVDGSGVTQPVSGTFWQATQPVSGTITANAGSGIFTNQQSNVQADYDTGAGTQNITMQGIALPASGGAVSGGTPTNPIRTDPTGTTTQPVSGTFWQATQPVSASSLPLPAGASTSAKQPTLGTAGVASTDVLTVQGIASMTALKVDGSGVTQPVSGTITANAGTNLNTSLLALESGGHLATIDSHIPALGQALSASSVPVVLTSAQQTALTPPAAITGFALEAGHIATIDTSTAASKTNLDTIVTNTNKIPTSPAQEGGNLATLAGGVTASVYQINNKQVNGTAMSVNQGTTDAGTQRVAQGNAGTGTKTNVASSATSGTILASNASRKGAMIYNDSTQVLYLDLSGGTASSSSYSVQVQPNGFFELPGPAIYSGAITGIWAAANGNSRITEFS